MKTIITMFILLSFYTVNAQENRSVNNLSAVSVELQTGVTIFYGDISRGALLPESRKGKKDYGMASALSVNVQTAKGVQTRIAVTSGTLNGIRYDIHGCYQRYFVNTFREADVTMAFELFKDRTFLKNLTVSSVAGLGVISYHSVLRSLLTNRLINTTGYTQLDGDLPEIKPDDPKMDVTGIMGGLVSYQVTDNFQVSIQHTYRLASSSQLDAIASSDFNDYYSYSSFGISYRIP